MSDIKGKDKGILDTFFDMADDVLDTAHRVGKGIPDEDGVISPDDDNTIDADYEDSPTPVEVPEGHPQVKTTPTARNLDIIMGCVLPDRHYHAFSGLDNVSLCGLTFPLEEIVGRRSLDRTQTWKSIVCFACLSIAIQGR